MRLGLVFLKVNLLDEVPVILCWVVRIFFLLKIYAGAENSRYLIHSFLSITASPRHNKSEIDNLKSSMYQLL